MNQQPDKIFHKKLENYQRPAPAGAWDRIDAGLDKKNSKKPWLKIAAALLLLCVAAYVLWYTSGTNDSAQPRVAQDLRDKQQRIEKESTNDSAPATNGETTAIAPEKKEEPAPVKKENKNVPLKKKTEELTQPSLALNEDQPQPVESSAAEDLLAENNPTTEPAESTEATSVASATPSAEEQPITLVFTADEADGYLDKKALTEATSDDKKPSTLKKLLKKAHDLKNNQDPLGELRQKKNEILALNFKSEKERGQNK